MPFPQQACKHQPAVCLLLLIEETHPSCIRRQGKGSSAGAHQSRQFCRQAGSLHFGGEGGSVASSLGAERCGCAYGQGHTQRRKRL